MSKSGQQLQQTTEPTHTASGKCENAWRKAAQKRPKVNFCSESTRSCGNFSAIAVAVALFEQKEEKSGKQTANEINHTHHWTARWRNEPASHVCLCVLAMIRWLFQLNINTHHHHQRRRQPPRPQFLETISADGGNLCKNLYLSAVYIHGYIHIYIMPKNWRICAGVRLSYYCSAGKCDSLSHFPRCILFI